MKELAAALVLWPFFLNSELGMTGDELGTKIKTSKIPTKPPNLQKNLFFDPNLFQFFFVHFRPIFAPSITKNPSPPTEGWLENK